MAIHETTTVLEAAQRVLQTVLKVQPSPALLETVRTALAPHVLKTALETALRVLEFSPKVLEAAPEVLAPALTVLKTVPSPVKPARASAEVARAQRPARSLPRSRGARPSGSKRHIATSTSPPKSSMRSRLSWDARLITSGFLRVRRMRSWRPSRRTRGK